MYDSDKERVEKLCSSLDVITFIYNSSVCIGGVSVRNADNSSAFVDFYFDEQGKFINVKVLN